MRAPLASLERIRYEHAEEILCACCHYPLDRHQPDEQRHDRLLGTCNECGAWYLIITDACVMILLPETQDEES